MILGHGSTIAPSDSSVKVYGGNRSDLAYSVQETSDGGFIVAGLTHSFGGWGKPRFPRPLGPEARRLRRYCLAESIRESWRGCYCPFGAADFRRRVHSGRQKEHRTGVRKMSVCVLS